MITARQIDEDKLYPDSDGKPMADNTEQYKWIVVVKENLEILFARDNNVFIAGDLRWYPVRSKIINPTAPDVMVVFGRPKGKRKSYRQWREENIPPQVVFEILSASNNDDEMERKLEFYQQYGVEEYYIYDPESYEIEGWLRSGDKLEQIEQVHNWVSLCLGIRFDTSQGELVIYRPDGERFLTSVQLRQELETERQRGETERQRASKLAEYLRSQGIDPDNLPER
ncbi:MAG: Uma2 family endonuclease [Nostocaceae cyanobacterium]|nr:Uma2 family endonuclease [Nostocaceae cyanobacterium]